MALIAIKCRSAYKEWVIELARRHRTTPSQLIDRALFEFSRADGFRPPPDR